jgi:Raf kinase inhibitor-like YbhB/YbcL family protein
MADAKPATLHVTSSTFKDGDTMPQSTLFDGMGVGGGNRSPHIAWSGAPPETRSYAIVVHDPDAPTGTGFFHWVAFDIPGDATELPEGAGASGAATHKHGHTDFGTTAYGGPAPPPGHGPHHYNFHVYALDVPEVGANANTTAALLRFLMLGHIVGEGAITGMYER